MMKSRDFVRLANRVELSANFAGSASGRQASQTAFSEGLSSVLMMLDQLDPIWLEEAFQFEEGHFSVVANALSVKEVWVRFLIEQTDTMHQAGVQQKAIQRLGTILSRWDRQAVTYEQLAAALFGLSETLSESESALHQRLLSADLKFNGIFQFANLLYGIALIGVAVDNRVNLQEKYPVVICSNARFVIDAVSVIGRSAIKTTSNSMRVD